MLTIILASPQVDQWQAFSDALASRIQADMVTVRTAADAIEAAQMLKPQLVVIDDGLGDLTAVDLIRRLLSIDAMIHAAVASAETEAIFHEATEGLGILMKLSPLPTSAEAGRLAECLDQLQGCIKETAKS
jgi:DNA-binding NarL/FixJ family response regulator